MRSKTLISLSTVYLFLLTISCSTDASTVSNGGDIAASWQVTAIHNSSPSGPTLGPGEGEVISINFETDGSFSGTTSSNSFGGRYSVNLDTLIISEMFTTEALDTNFGLAFYEAFDESRNTDTGSSEFEMRFNTDGTVDLQYQGFKYLTLQRQ